jgi:C4-dicarboxylate transporter/malic acid transport protein
MSEPSGNKSKLKAFVPSWPSVIMGTGALTIALNLSKGVIPATGFLAPVFLIITLVISLIILWTSVLRLIYHPKQLWEDLKHPVTGSFVPTMPISLMILAIDLAQVDPTIFSHAISHTAAIVLFWIGTTGIYLFSWIILPLLFQNEKVSYDHGTYGWYIPPVSHLIIPVLGFDLIQMSHSGVTINLMFMVSLMSLGIGFVLFILVGANIMHRYLYNSSPTGKMAPTIIIGLAPTAILAIIAVKISAVLGLSPESFIRSYDVAFWIGLPLWGFSIWWMILSFIKIITTLIKTHHSFSLSWWSLTFPMGTLAIATGALNKILKIPALDYI